MNKKKVFMLGAAMLVPLGAVLAFTANEVVGTLAALPNLNQGTNPCELNWTKANKITNFTSRAGTVELVYGPKSRVTQTNEHVGLEVKQGANAFVMTSGRNYANGVGGKVNGLNTVTIKATRTTKNANAQLVLATWNTENPSEVSEQVVDFKGNASVNVTLDAPKATLKANQFKIFTKDALNKAAENDEVFSIETIYIGCDKLETLNPVDEGEIKDNIFEFEDAYYDGVSKKKDHMCINDTLAYNAGFSGHMAMRNVAAGTKRTFTFTSDKAVRVTAIVNSSNGESSIGHPLTDKYEITINNSGNVDASALISDKGSAPAGMSATYFTMVNTPITISLQKGINTLTFKNKIDSAPNLDFINIKTSATLVDQTVCNWASIQDSLQVNTAPTETTGGKINYFGPCNHKGYTFDIPALNSGKYVKVNTADEVSTSLHQGKDVFGLPGSKYKITLSEGTVDGVATKVLVGGTTITPTYEAPADKILLGWENAENPNQKFGLTFKSPFQVMTLKPTLVNKETVKVTVTDGANFGEGVTTKDAFPGDKLTINVADKEYSKHAGWINNETNEIYKGKTFVTPLKPISIRPYFEGATTGWAKTPLAFSQKNTPVKCAIGGALMGNEIGTTVTTPNIAKNQVITFETPAKYNAKHEVVTVLTNRGTAAIKIQFNQFTSYASSGSNNQKSTISELITLKPGEIIEVRLTYPSAWSNNNMLSKIWFREAATNVNVGLYQYFHTVK